MEFRLRAPYKPTGDQPQAIEKLSEGVLDGIRSQVLVGVTGSGFEKAVKTTCFLADINDFGAFNEVYGKYFTTKPARSCVAVKDLPKGVKVEVEVIATL